MEKCRGPFRPCNFWCPKWVSGMEKVVLARNTGVGAGDSRVCRWQRHKDHGPISSTPTSARLRIQLPVVSATSSCLLGSRSAIKIPPTCGCRTTPLLCLIAIGLVWITISWGIRCGLGNQQTWTSRKSTAASLQRSSSPQASRYDFMVPLQLGIHRIPSQSS